LIVAPLLKVCHGYDVRVFLAGVGHCMCLFLRLIVVMVIPLLEVGHDHEPRHHRRGP
jgi:hypothetical protein